jgi:hypothetical protein
MSWTVPGVRQLTRPASAVLVVAAGAWAGVVVVNPGQMGGM